LTGKKKVYLALIHHPVYNKTGQVITSAVTNLDLHDIARAARTYGVRRFYVVTPLEDQKELAGRIISHWIHGGGGRYNPDRRTALELVRIVSSMEAVLEDISEEGQDRPITVSTDARPHPNNISFAGLSKILASGQCLLLVFGTAWGLTKQSVEAADYALAPITGGTGYNHLSVRSAVSIVLDRLLGVDR
jgi:hypothetical protein